MNIYVGKNKLKAKKITLKELIYKQLLNVEDESIEITEDEFSDKSASWINIAKKIENINKGVRIDLVVGFSPEEKNKINELELFVTEKLTGYDDENTFKLK